jgi:hypothetical protein
MKEYSRMTELHKEVRKARRNNYLLLFLCLSQDM